jgi:hypothetical protein
MDDEQVLMDERDWTGMSELHSHFVIVNILLCLGNFDTNYIIFINAEILEKWIFSKKKFGWKKMGK